MIGMIHSVQIPDAVVHVPDIYDLRIQIKGKLLLVFKKLSVLLLKFHLCPGIGRPDIPLIGGCLCTLPASVENDKIGILHHIHKKRLHILHIQIKGSGVHQGNALGQKPALGQLHVS